MGEEGEMAEETQATRPADAAISHWETPEAASSLGTGDCLRKCEEHQNMADGRSHVADIWEDVAETANFYHPQPCNRKAWR